VDTAVTREVGRLGTLLTGAGVATALAGAAAWVSVATQLGRERITVPTGATLLPGRPVRGPLTALAQAEFIRAATLESSGGRTYGEMDEDDPLSRMAMEASLLRSSLFTSVLAFGVSASQIGLGAALVAAGTAIRRLAARPD
jgi:hypothetical protein